MNENDHAPILDPLATPTLNRKDSAEMAAVLRQQHERRRMAQAAADAGHPWGEASLRQMDDTDRQEDR